MSDLTRKTLIEIASVSRGLADMLVKCSGSKTSESFQLEKISVASAAMMETLNKVLLMESDVIDGRIKDWLGSGEPKKCLDILNQMAASLSPKLDRGVKILFRSSSPASSKDQSIQAIKLFWKHEGYFHFLLSTNIWNREAGLQQQSVKVPSSSILRTQELSTKQDLTQVAPKSPSSVTEHRKKNILTGVDGDIDGMVKWLSAWNCKEMHEHILLLRQADTCLWLPRTKAYQSWKGTENSFLWLHGKPGAGKSVLAASVIDALKSSLEDGEVLAYFYCNFRNERTTSAAEVLRSLLSQLVQSFRHHAVDPSDFIGELIKERDEGASVIHNCRLLARYISRATKQLARQPFLVIDALDECKDVESILDAFAEMQKGGSRLFVTSRPLQVIKESLSGLPSIDMDMSNYEISEDIKLHVTRELDSVRRLRRLGANLKNHIHAVLCKKADGMFRWVQCQLDNLERCMTPLQIRQALLDLPNSLNETYERILLQISQYEHGSEFSQRALNWLVVALAPLRLSQIMEGLSIDPSKQVLDRDSGPVHPSALLDVLSSLVTHDEVTDIVILSRFSVKEYLIAVSTRAKHRAYHVDEQSAHTEVALLCMSWIGSYLEHQRSGHCGGSPQKAHRRQLHDLDLTTHSENYHWSPLGSFGEYVLSCGFHHLYYVNPQKEVVFHAIETLHLNVQQHSSEWNHLCRRQNSYPPWPTPKHDFMLYLLIAFAPPPILSSFIGHSHLELKDGTNPLIYAACFGKIEHARILLSNGVSLNHLGWDIYDRARILPFEAAVRSSEALSMINMFLDEGSCVLHNLFRCIIIGILPSSTFTTGRYLCHPSIASRLMQTDEFVKWSLNVMDEELFLKALDPQTYMHQASQQHIDIIHRRLIQIGCNLQSNETSLRHAISAGHVSLVRNMILHNIPLPSDIILDASDSMMIRLCINMGSNVNAVSSTKEDTALHLAQMYSKPLFASSSDSEEECSEKVQALIDAGCNPSRCNLAGKTPLHIAVEHGYMSIAEKLLPLHVPLPHDILLATRSESANSSLIRLLVCKGANAHIIAANGNSPLHRVLTDRCGFESEEVLKCITVLIDAGCDPCLSNAAGQTPFQAAVKKGHLSVVRYLYDMFNPPLLPDILLTAVNQRYGLFQCPGRLPVINFLISKGASVHVPCPNGDTLVHVAIMVSEFNPEDPNRRECLKIIEALVKAGCDPNACNLAGETPFHIAAREEHISIMEYLLSRGISVPSNVMLTQFEYLDPDFSLGPTSPHLTIPFLLEKGGYVHTISGSGDTLLHLAAHVRYEKYALELSKDLVHAGCTTGNAVNSKHETPLHIAARRGHTSVVEYLLSLNIALPPDILLAASTGVERKAQLIQYLVQAGADVSVATTDGNGPLHLLLTFTHIWREEIEYDRLECVQILIEAGCNLSAQNIAGETPLHAAAKSGFKNILEYLLAQSVPLPHDILLVSTTWTMIRFLLAKGLDLCGIAANEGTKMMCHVLESSSGWDSENDSSPLEFARTLISAGWDPSSRDSAGETLIHVAAREGRIDVIKFFLSQNVLLPPDILFVAVTRKSNEANIPLTRFLIREGASFHASGDTLLHLAITNNFASEAILESHKQWSWKTRKYNSGIVPGQMYSWEVIEILLNHGADPYARNADGQTAIDLAEERGHFFKENFLRLVRNSRAIGSPHTLHP